LGTDEFNQAVAEAVQLGLADAPLRTPDAQADTAGQQVFRTVGGRRVYGGGGIQPDLVMPPDTLTVPEQRLRAGMIEAQVSLETLSLRFAVDWVRANPGIRPTEITPELRRAFVEFVDRETNEAIDPVILREGSGLMDYRLHSQLASVAFDEEAGLKVLLARQAEVQEAASLLRDARSPEQLIALAAVAKPTEVSGG